MWFNQQPGKSPLGAPINWPAGGPYGALAHASQASKQPGISLSSMLSQGATAEGYDPQAPTGTGASFLNSLAYGGRRLDDPGQFIDPMAGGAFDDNSPFLAQQFLQSQMRPGGFLSDAYQNRVASLGLRGMVGSGMDAYRRSMNSLGASGLNRRYAAGISGGILDRMTMGARQYMTQQEAQQQERQFEASKGLIDLMMESARTSKQNYVNYLTAKEGAAATKSAGKASGFGSIVGGILGGLF